MKYFPPFQFDERSRVLRRAGAEVPVTRKAGELAGCLIARAGTLVTHAELVKAVWPDTHVQPENLKALVHELRGALGDSADAPRFIRSEPGRGYVFVAQVTDAMVPLLSDGIDGRSPAIVGRERELATLERRFAAAVQRGETQVVVIDGDRGLGKTSLCEALAQRAASDAALRISYAQGLEAVGPVQPYGLLIEAIDALARQYPVLVADTLARRARTWLSLLTQDDGTVRSALRAGEGDGAIGVEPMARELAAALDDLAAEVPLLLVLDDLHWADARSIECLQILCRRLSRSRLCLVLSYCGSSAAPALPAIERIARDLHGASRGEVLALRPLTEADLQRQLALRIGRPARTLAGPIFRAVGGNPSAAINVIGGLARLGALYETSSGWRLASPAGGVEAVLAGSVSDALRDQIEGLPVGDRVMLEAAAAAGPEFAAPAVAALLGVDGSYALAIEQRLRLLAGRELLVEVVAGPTGPAVGPAAPVFRLRHPLAAQVLVAGGPLARQLRQLRIDTSGDDATRQRA